jgi:hypothetical protein
VYWYIVELLTLATYILLPLSILKNIAEQL